MAMNEHPPGRVTVQTPGTPVQLSSISTPVAVVEVQALRNNTGYCCIGGPEVRARDGEQNRISIAVPVASGPQMRTYRNTNLCKLYVDVSVAGEGIVFEYE